MFNELSFDTNGCGIYVRKNDPCCFNSREELIRVIREHIGSASCHFKIQWTKMDNGDWKADLIYLTDECALSLEDSPENTIRVDDIVDDQVFWESIRADARNQMVNLRDGDTRRPRNRINDLADIPIEILQDVEYDGDFRVEHLNTPTIAGTGTIQDYFTADTTEYTRVQTENEQTADHRVQRDEEATDNRDRITEFVYRGDGQWNINW